MKKTMCTFWLWIGMLLCVGVSVQAAVLFSDIFLTETGVEIQDLTSPDCDGGRAGDYADKGYLQEPDSWTWQHQVRTTNELLLSGNGKIGVNYDLAAESVGGFKATVDIAPARNADVTNDNWCSVTIGAGGLNDVWGGGFGVLFRKNGTIQVIDNGTTIVNDTITWNDTPDNDYHTVSITANDAGDNNPFDGSGIITFEIFVDEVSIYSVTLDGSAYISNYVNLQGQWEENMFDNLLIEVPQLVSNRLPKNGVTDLPVTTTFSWTEPNSFSPIAYDVYVGTDPNETTFVSTAEFKSLAQSNLTFDPIPDLEFDTTYYWRVDAYEPNGVYDPILHQGARWTFTTRQNLPYIESHPQSLTVAAGETVTLSVFASDVNLYTWKRASDGLTVLSGPQASSLVINDVQIADEDYYYCELSNTGGTAVSNAAGVWITRLVSHWKFEDNLIDSEAGKNGSYTGQTELYADGIAGRCLDLSPEPNYVEITGAGDFYNFYAQGYSLSFWVKSEDLTANLSPVSKRNSTPSAGLVVFVYADGRVMASLEGLGSLWDDNVTGSTSVDDNGWHHIVATYNPQDRIHRLYINGLLEASSPAKPENVIIPVLYPGSAGLRFGVSNELGEHPYEGMLDDVRIYSYAIDPLMIAHLYTDLSGQKVCVESLYYDTTGPEGQPDCRVNLYDFADMSSHWLECNIVPDTYCQ